MIITIDGPAGTGKSSVTKRVAQALNYDYFDTGALYRSFTYFIMTLGINPSDEDGVVAAIPGFQFEIVGHYPNLRYKLGEQDVTEQIRSFEINQYVSITSAYPLVRARLIQFQRDYAKGRNCIFEGRDLGSVVFPYADLKIFLTASAEVRAQRRYKELVENKTVPLPTYEEILEQISLRDKIDSTRKVAPLKCPEGALFIDTSDLTIDEVVARIVRAKKKLESAVPSWMTCKKMTFLYRLVLSVTWIIAKICYRHKVVGSHHVPKERCLIAVNHVSFLDPPLLAISAPSAIHFLARDTLFKPNWFGAFIRRLNCHPLRRDGSDITALKTVINLLNQGEKVLIFPQGTRSSTYEVEEIKAGVYFIAAKTKVKVVPTFIAGPLEIWPRKAKFPKLSGRTICLFGAPIVIDEELDAPAAQRKFLQELKDSMNELGQQGKNLLRPR